MIKMIASDLDGTMLWGPNKIMREESLQLVQEILDQGRIFVAASGRQYANQRRLFAPVKDKIGYICENGSLLMHEGKILKRYTFERELGIELMQSILEKEDCEVLLSGVETCYIQPKKESYTDHMIHFVKNNVTIVDDICAVEEPFLKISIYREQGIQAVAHDWDDRFGHRMNIAVSDGLWIDMGPFGADKGSALQEMCRVHGICPEEVLVIGDSFNDIPLLRTAGYPIAMEAAPEELKQYAKETTTDVNDVLRAVLRGEYD